MAECEKSNLIILPFSVKNGSRSVEFRNSIVHLNYHIEGGNIIIEIQPPYYKPHQLKKRSKSSKSRQRSLATGTVPGRVKKRDYYKNSSPKGQLTPRKKRLLRDLKIQNVGYISEPLSSQVHGFGDSRRSQCKSRSSIRLRPSSSKFTSRSGSYILSDNSIKRGRSASRSVSKNRMPSQKSATTLRRTRSSKIPIDRSVSRKRVKHRKLDKIPEERPKRYGKTKYGKKKFTYPKLRQSKSTCETVITPKNSRLQSLRSEIDFLKQQNRALRDEIIRDSKSLRISKVFDDNHCEKDVNTKQSKIRVHDGC